MKPNLSYKEIIQTEISICIPCFSFSFPPAQSNTKLDSKFNSYPACTRQLCILQLYDFCIRYWVTIY